MHIPENSYNATLQKRAADSFKYCTVAVSMFLETGETIFMNSAAEQFYGTGFGMKFDNDNRLLAVMQTVVAETDKRVSLQAAQEAGEQQKKLDGGEESEEEDHGGRADSLTKNPNSRKKSCNPGFPYDIMKEAVFKNGGSYSCTVSLPGNKYHKLNITAGIDPVSGAKVAVLCQDDVTDRVSLLVELGNAAVGLQDMNNRKDMLFANMSHELKTPLNGIIALTDTLIEDLETVIDDEAMGSLKNILISGKRLNNLVTNLLDASLLKNKKLLLRMTDDCKFFGLVDNILTLSRSTNVNKDVELINGVDHGLPVFKTDSDRLAQIVSNLVNNALKFTSIGSITVRCSFKAYKKKGEFVYIDVVDTGIGIAPEHHQKIFEALRQVDESADRKFGGTGLGLTISKDLAIAMGGGITLESKPGRGSTFTVFFPMYNSETPKRARSKLSSQASGSLNRSASSVGSASDYGGDKNDHDHDDDDKTTSEKSVKSAMSSAKGGVVNAVSKSSVSVCSRRTSNMSSVGDPTLTSCADATGQIELLSVDDEPTNQAVVAATLRKRNFKITRAMDGLEALAILKERKESGTFFPDIILLDVMMPNMNGFDCCAKIREEYPLSALPIIMVSAKNREENIIQGLACGSNDYVTKPFGKLELTARIDTQLQLRASWKAELEREKSDVLLRSMLPDHIINKLKNASDKDEPICEAHDHTVILFSDVVGFTSLSASVPTTGIIGMLNSMFGRFDTLTERTGCSKIETIGDAYSE